MQEQNPFQFFLDLADERPIQQKEETMPYRGIGWTDELAKGADDVSISCDDITGGIPGYWYSNYFNSELPEKMANERSYSIQHVDNILAAMPDIGQAFSRLTEFVNTIDTVITKLGVKTDVQDYPSVMEACNGLKRDLNERKKQLIRPDKDSKQSPVKVQWLGQVNVLGTLFYHLLRGQDGGQPYISASVEQVKRMLVDNFVDSEGHDLSKGTLDTIFMPSRSEKRANVGDRIELPNKKNKK